MGELIAGRYVPIEAAVTGRPRRARDQATAQTVLLHTIGGLSDVAAAAARIGRAVGVFHPAMLTVFDVVRLDEGLLIACEFVPSQTISQLMGGQPLNPRRAAQLTVELADALAELHARGVVHGAIGTDAMVVTLKGKAKLSLIPAVTAPAGREGDDVAALASLGAHMAGGPLIDTVPSSAAVLAAMLR